MCTSPLIRAETYETYTNQKGKKSYKVEWLPRDMFDRNVGKNKSIYDILPRYRRVTPVPCGQCHECLLQHSRDWADRCILERDYGYVTYTPEDTEHKNPIYIKYPKDSCWFITLTYSDENLEIHHTLDTETGEIHEGTTVNVETMKKFWKRVRKKYPEAKIKYLECGEYGSKTQRPHYHAIVFGLPLDQTQFKKVGMCESMHTPRWTSPELEKLWGLGLVDIGRVTWESCAYVARYALKKVEGKNAEWYQAQGRKPEFIAMSNGLGQAYYMQHKEKIYETDSVPIANKKTGVNSKPPLAYDRLLRETDEELYNSIKTHRKHQGESAELLLRTQTDLTPEERRKIAEERMARVIKDLRQEV